MLSRTGNDMEYLQVLDKYRKDFDNILDTSWRAYNGRVIDHKLPKYCHLLYTSIEEIRKLHQPKTRSLSKKDFEQQLHYIWISTFRAFVERKPIVHLRMFLIRMSIWVMRDWIRNQLLIRTNERSGQTEIDPDQEDENDVGFKLDLAFLLYGTDRQPLGCLTPYERQLIYLRYRYDMTTTQIAQIVHRHPKSIAYKINEIHRKLRE